MRKVRIDSNVLGVLSAGANPFSLLHNRNSLVKNITLQNDDSRKYCFCPELKSVSVAEITEKRRLSSFKNMDEKPQYSGAFPTEGNADKRFSTFEDLQLTLSLLKEILEYRKSNSSGWISESKVKKLCNMYKCLLKDHRNVLIQMLSQDYAISHKQVFLSVQALARYSTLSEGEAKRDGKIAKIEDQLRNLLNPQYSWLFLYIGKLEKGVKFLVDLRTDALNLISQKNAEGKSTIEIQQLNTTLRDLLSLWFSVGFLRLERVTWRSSCEMLQKISEYEAVHPVRNWTDLKRRVGPYRRCFVFLHASMPGEPIVVLHTALCDKIASSMKDIASARKRMSVDSGKEALLNPQEEDPNSVKAAVFYSITSTQKGLQGIELGNYLIKSVVHELQVEFPQMTQFSSLSPIPNFRSWFMDKLKSSEKGPSDIFQQDELTSLKAHLNAAEFWRDLRKLFVQNSWIEDKDLVTLLEKPLMRNCARYLFSEKRRGYAYDTVANFHLRNGAVMWRLNWLADTSTRGLGNSCSIMVNYRYFLEDTEFNSRNYLESKAISSSEQISDLVEQAQQLIVVSKM